MPAWASLKRDWGQFLTSGSHFFLLALLFKMKTPMEWLVVIALMIFISFFASLSSFRRYRAIHDTPTSRIASAAQGYVEIAGEGKPATDYPIQSAVTGQNVLWYRFQVLEKQGKGWHVVESDESDSFFVIQDKSGSCLVDPDHAEIFSAHQRDWQEGGRRYIEWHFVPGDKLYAIGNFKSISVSEGLDLKRDMGLLLEEWKQNRPALLKRFDLDNSGEIDAKEWALARAAARREINKKHAEIRSKVTSLHTLSAPTSGQFYLISNTDPNDFARRYGWWTVLHLVVFFSCLACLPWLLSVQKF